MKKILIFILVLFVSRMLIAQDAGADNTIVVNDPESMAPDEFFIPFGRSETWKTTGAITVLNAEDLMEFDNNLDVLTALRGRVPGLFGSTTIRGRKDPVIVIDGTSRSFDGISAAEILTDLSLMEVEQIAVLKDAVSSMLYGAQADQGVIMITTKRGKPGTKVRTVIAEYGISNPISYPEYLSAGEYMELYNEALFNDGKDPLYSDSEIQNTINGTDPVLYPDESFYNSTYLKEISTFFKVKAEASGGSKNMQYYTNLGWQRDNELYNLGEAANSSRNKINIRGNVDYRINNWLSASLDAIGYLGINKGPNGDPSNNWNGDFWQYSTQILPNYFQTLIPASRINDPDLINAATLIDGKYILGGTNQFRNNIYGNFTKAGYKTYQQLFLNTNLGFDFDFTRQVEGLKAKVYISYRSSNDFILRQDNTYAIYEPYPDTSAISGDSLLVTKYGNDVKVDNQTITDQDALRSLGFYGTLSYNRLFDNVHRVSFLALSYFDRFIGMKETYHQKHQHFGFRGTYIFDDRIVAEFGGAMVGSGKLPPGSMYEFAPGFGAAWIVSEEDFLSGSEVISFLKIKASYGIQVTDRFLGYYNFENSYGTSGSFYYNQASGNNNTVRSFSNVANPDINMSRGKKLNVGVESGIFGNTVWMEVNYFKNVLTGYPVIRTNYYPSVLGGVIPLENYEEYGESGFDLGLSYNGEIGDFLSVIGANLTYVLPEAILVDESPNPDAPGRLLQGKPYDAMFGYIAEGLFKNDEDIASHASQSFGEVKPGDIKYRDVNEDGLVDENDMVQIGNSDSRVQYDLHLTLKYRNLSLFALATGQLGGNIIFDDPYYWVYGNDRKYSKVVLDRWIPGDEDAEYPRLTTGNGSNNYRNSTFWVRDNNWFKLHTLQLNYSLSDGIAFTKYLKIYLRAANLLTISKIKDEMERNIGKAPQMRNYSIGIVVGL